MAQKKKGRIGSTLDGFLAEEGILETCEEQALKQILADQIKVPSQLHQALISRLKILGPVLRPM